MKKWIQKWLGIEPKVYLGAPITVKPMAIGSMFRDFGWPRRNNLNITAGVLTPDKNMKEAIDMIAEREDEYLLIFGEGPDRQKLQNRIDMLGVSDRIFICGMISRELLAVIMNLAETFISTSKKEGYGLALREAKVCGCTLISYTGDGRDDVEVDISLGDVKEVFK